MEVLESIEYNGYTINIIPDELAPNPRTEFDHLGTIVCGHSRYELGDIQINDSSFDREKFEKDVKNGKIIALDVYLYDHSGITINTTGFSCPWDSGQIGYIFVDKKKVREEYLWKRITKAREELIREYLRNEVKEYDNFLTGSIYGYRVIKGDEDIDSCWGFSGTDNEKSGLLSEAKSAIDYHKNDTEIEQGLQMELELT